MSLPSLTDVIQRRAQSASHAVLVGDRPLKARWAVTLGLLMGLSLHYTQEMGALMGPPIGPLASPDVVQMADMAPKEVPAPAGTYRVDVMDLTDARVITSVHLDSEQWSEFEQRTFLRKLVIQADQRGVSRDRALVVHAYAVDGDTQMQAQAFLKQAIDEAGIQPTTSDMALDGNLKASGRPAGLRFDYDTSGQSLDRLGSDPCLVRTGDEVGCILNEDQATARPGSLEQAITSPGVAIANASSAAAPQRRHRPR